MSERAVPVNLPPVVSEAFLSAAVTALRELTQFEALPGAEQAAATLPRTESVVTARMSLARTNPGLFALVMSVKTAESIAARYLPQGTELSDDIVNDVVGEFANVIAGQAKTMLKGTPYHFLLSLPSVQRCIGDLPASSFVSSLAFESGEVQLHIDLAAEVRG